MPSWTNIKWEVDKTNGYAILIAGTWAKPYNYKLDHFIFIVRIDMR